MNPETDDRTPRAGMHPEFEGRSIRRQQPVREAFVRRTRGFVVGILLVASCSSRLAGTEPYRPADDAQVVARLPRALVSATSGNPRAPAPAGRPGTTPAEAASVARQLIEQARRESDPRLLVRARQALAPWWEQADTPATIALLQGVIRQGRHEFAAAELDFRQALRRDPRLSEAWLNLAVVQMVRGDFAAARQSVLGLALGGDGLAAVAAGSALASLTGQATPARQQLEAALARHGSAPPPVRVWAMQLLAEIAWRQGDLGTAGARFRDAITLDHNAAARTTERDVGTTLAGVDSHLAAAYAGFLVDTGRASEALDLLDGPVASEALLLQKTLATRALGRGSRTLDQELASRFAEARLRGDRGHAREESVFLCRVADRPLDALERATANWDSQREPADVRGFLEAALAAGNHAAAAPAIQFLETNRLEDVRLQPLVARLKVPGPQVRARP